VRLRGSKHGGGVSSVDIAGTRSWGTRSLQDVH
jgi:hypothetical protein